MVGVRRNTYLPMIKTINDIDLRHISHPIQSKPTLRIKACPILYPCCYELLNAGSN